MWPSCDIFPRRAGVSRDRLGFAVAEVKPGVKARVARAPGARVPLRAAAPRISGEVSRA